MQRRVNATVKPKELGKKRLASSGYREDGLVRSSKLGLNRACSIWCSIHDCEGQIVNPAIGALRLKSSALSICFVDADWNAIEAQVRIARPINVLRDNAGTQSMIDTVVIDCEIEGIFHYAFLTRDHLSKLGFEKYVTTNTNILELMSEALPSLKYRWLVAISSGAIYEPITRKLSEDINTNPYGFLKIFEENSLKKISGDHGSNCVIGRLWASSGSLMPLDRKYALSDFIYQGVTSNQILVNSSHEVWRRYIDAQDFISVLHRMAIEGLNQTIDSSGELIEIGDLASKIGLLTTAEVVRSNSGPLSAADLYYPEGVEMQQLAQKYFAFHF